MDNTASVIHARTDALLTGRSGFYVGIALLLLAYVITGFWPKYFGGAIDPSITAPNPRWIIQ